MTVMVDLNVVLDVVQHRLPHYEASAECLTKIVRKEVIGFLPAHAITTLHYITQKLMGSHKADNITEWMLRYFEIAPESREVFLQARVQGFFDFEDAVVSVLAREKHCQYIITRNIVDFKESQVKAITPDEFLVIIAS